MIRTEYTANEFLATTDAKRYAHRAARTSYTPKATMGPVEIAVKILAVVAVVAALGFLLAGGF
jgi:hypothetical protein